MIRRRWAAVAVGLVAAATLGSCSCSNDGDSPPSAGDVDVPTLSDNDRLTLDEQDGAIPAFVDSTSDLPADAAGCEERLADVAQSSIDARTVASGLEDAELQGLLVNHSAAVWDYLRLCAEGEDTNDVEQELAFYQEVLDRWLDA